MRKNMLNKGLTIEIIILFLGISIFSNVSGNIVIEKNSKDVVNTQITDDYDTSGLLYGHRLYMIGRIFNLTYDENEYSFEYNNLRIFEYWHSAFFRNWGFSYEHRGYVDGEITLGGFKFRGILTPTFVCGCFHSTLL